MLPRAARIGAGIALSLSLLLGIVMRLGAGQGTAYAADGDFDPSFGTGGRVTTDFVLNGASRTDQANAVAIQPDGKIVAVGTVQLNDHNYDFALARYNTDGSLDGTFGVNGIATGDFYNNNVYSIDEAYGLAFQPDGKIVVVGRIATTYGFWFGVTRFTANGFLDTTFGDPTSPGRAWVNFHGYYGEEDAANGVTIQADGKIVIAGYATLDGYQGAPKFALARLNPDGSIDNSFDGDGRVTTDFFGSDDEIRAVAMQGSLIIVAGYAHVSGPNYDFALARFNPDGSLDNTFDGDGKVTTDFFGGDDGAFAMALQPDGKIVAAGGFYSAAWGYDFGVIRYLSDGNVDTGFGGDGFQDINFQPGTAEESAYAVAIQPSDGKIVLAGYAPGADGYNDFALARLNPDGNLDGTFGTGGKLTHDFGGGVAIARGVAVQADGKIVSAGYAYMNDVEMYDFSLARYLSGNPPTPTPAPTMPAPTDTPTPTNTPVGTGTPPSATPTFAATSTPSATVTGTPPTATPTATTCPIQFTDVPVGSTFYPYIRCLACRGVINGYPDGTFKPNNNVTRGQLSKIVSNSAGFNDPQTTQMFQDVPAGSTFQVYIGRLASRGYINGYPCGNPEPCVPPNNLPYFRPNNNATRGQISKIDSNAADFSDPPAGQQFEDVPVGSTYYTYTYRLVSRGVMSGYPCGGANEPCIPPANLPYFRPNNNATRGQTSKIVSNTFFADCQTPARATRR